MSTVTLAAIQDKYAEIGALIMTYQSQQTAPRYIEVGIVRQSIKLAAGEEYVGSIINADGTARAIVLLPGDQEDINWKDAMAWAESIGGTLPTRVEQALLYANHSDKFDKRAYWSCQQHAEDSGYAWYQTFYYGYQGSYGLSAQLRARAVRSIAI